MSVLSGKNIVLGVTAGIAAYKSAFLVRLLVKVGANREGCNDAFSKRICNSFNAFYPFQK